MGKVRKAGFRSWRMQPTAAVELGHRFRTQVHQQEASAGQGAIQGE